MSTVNELYDEAIAEKESAGLEATVAKLEALLSDNPDYALAHAALSVFLGKLDRHDEAVEHAQKVCELDEEDPFSYTAMSIVCQKAGKLPEAEAALAKAMEKQWSARQRDQ